MVLTGVSCTRPPRRAARYGTTSRFIQSGLPRSPRPTTRPACSAARPQAPPLNLLEPVPPAVVVAGVDDHAATRGQALRDVEPDAGLVGKSFGDGDLLHFPAAAATANFPLSVFLNRDSFPLVLISRKIAE